MNDYLEKVLTLLQTLTGIEVEDPEKPLRQYGLTSLGLADTIAELEEYYDTEVPDHMIANIENARELAETVEQCLKKG